MNQKVLASFKKQESKLRIVIATLTFGIGFDCPDIGQIIHYGPTSLWKIKFRIQEGQEGMVFHRKLF